MRVAVFSDVHANLLALETFVKATRSNVDSYACLGDVVNCGPWNDECLEMVTELPGIRFVEGNHERLFIGSEDVANEIPLIQDFFRVSRANFTRHDLIVDLPLEFELGKYRCHHMFHDKKVYPDTVMTLEKNHIIGHSHHQFRIEDSGFELLNPGSVGQNRHYIDRVEYLILDTVQDSVEMHSIPYDFERFLAELKQRRYPAQCIAYYSSKPRHNS